MLARLFKQPSNKPHGWEIIHADSYYGSQLRGCGKMSDWAKKQFRDAHKRDSIPEYPKYLNLTGETYEYRATLDPNYYTQEQGHHNVVYERRTRLKKASPAHAATGNKSEMKTSKRVAFCLVENSQGHVLLIQRAYGKEKGKWSLPGGFVDQGESSRAAARRETKEETRISVEIISTVMVGQTSPIKVFAGRILGGKLKFQPKECLDARFHDPAKLPRFAFGWEKRAIQNWSNLKNGRAGLSEQPLPGQCPHCQSPSIRLRHWPHNNPYRCNTCHKSF